MLRFKIELFPSFPFVQDSWLNSIEREINKASHFCRFSLSSFESFSDFRNFDYMYVKFDSIQSI